MIPFRSNLERGKTKPYCSWLHTNEDKGKDLNTIKVILWGAGNLIRKGTMVEEPLRYWYYSISCWGGDSLDIFFMYINVL